MVGLSIAFRAPGGTDPVQYGILQPALTFQDSFLAEHMGTEVGIGVPIPDSPGMEGLTILFQYLFVLPDLSFGWSDVFGANIHGSAAQAASASAAPASAGLTQPTSVGPSSADLAALTQAISDANPNVVPMTDSRSGGLVRRAMRAARKRLSGR